MKNRSIFTISATVLIIAVMWFSSPAFNRKSPISVSVINPEIKDIYDSVISKGNIEDGDAREIRVAASSQVKDVYIEVGDKVEAGQVLFDVVSSSRQTLTDISAFIPEVEKIDYKAVELLAKQYGIDPEYYLGQILPAFNASEEVTESSITSPISGVVTSLEAKENGTLSGYRAAAVVSDLSKLYVRVQIPELYINRIKTGQEADITGDAFTKTYRGKVEKIYPTATKKSSLTGSGETVVDTLISIENPDGALKPGYSVNAKIYTKKKKSAVTIPYNCILQDEKNNESVFVIKNGTAYKKSIVTGLELDDEIEVTYGLSGAEKVILSPTAQLKDGDKIKEARG